MAPATEVNMTPDAAAPAAAAKPADAPAAEKPAESTDASPPADAAPLDKFSGAPGEDYIQWRVRVEARLRSSGLWPVAEGDASAPSSSAARALVISALSVRRRVDGGGKRHSRECRSSAAT